jgi:alkaline phosphatase D
MISRRTMLKLISTVFTTPWTAFAKKGAPVLNVGCASGDVTTDGAMIWSRADRTARMWVEIDHSPTFNHAKRFAGDIGSIGNDFNLHCEIKGLDAGKSYFYRIQAESLREKGQFSAPLIGQFTTAPNHVKNIRFCWSGDVVGQGYGIDRARGGMKIFQTLTHHHPDFFVHSGDQIYADNPLQAIQKLDDGTIWQNVMTAGKSHVAETTQAFRENYYYNFLDEHYRNFYATVPLYQQWDDHEVRNNWYPSEVLTDQDYHEKNVTVLAKQAKKALFDCNPMRFQATQRVYRNYRYGPLLELFMIDLRSYRGPNTQNRQPQQSSETAFLGQAQLDWLKQALAESTATWKIICSDMPIGLIVQPWQTDLAENGANGNGPPLGRELEIAGLLNFIHRQAIKNTHFITADVHYCASYHYQPKHATYKDFSPFWEFISGPLHAGTFGPNAMDNTFGPEAKFIGIPNNMKPNRPPSDGFQFFGQMDIDAKTQALTVSHFDVADNLLWSKTLQKEI